MARPGLMRHRKFARLARLVGSRPLARGHLEMLWEVAYENGDAVLGDAGDVEQLAEWAGEPGALAAALVEAGFLDEANGVLLVHDLYDHAPAYVQRRAVRESERQAKGKTLSALRAEAGRKGGKASGAARRAHGSNREPDASDGESSEAPHAPAPSPAPTPEKIPPPRPLAQAPAPARGEGEDLALAADGPAAPPGAGEAPAAAGAGPTPSAVTTTTDAAPAAQEAPRGIPGGLSAEQAARETARAVGAEHRARALADADLDGVNPGTAALLGWLRQRGAEMNHASSRATRSAIEQGVQRRQLEELGPVVLAAWQASPRSSIGWFMHEISPESFTRRGAAAAPQDIRVGVAAPSAPEAFGQGGYRAIE